MKNRIREQIRELSDKELIKQLYFTQFLLLAISAVLSISLYGLSYWQQINWFDYRVITIGVTAGIFVVSLDTLFMHLLPSSYYDDGGLNERIFRNQSFFQMIIITLIVAFSEEMLFRGIIQARLGLVWASLIFAAIHFRYLYNWFLLINVVFLSFLIGCVFNWTENLAVTIMMHFVIDFLLGVQIKWKNSKKDNKEEGSFDE